MSPTILTVAPITKLPSNTTWLLAASLLLSLLGFGHLVRPAAGPAQASRQPANYSLSALPTAWQYTPYAQR